ncbi:hypothetical protein HYPSUDRAFT_763762 [Hypholoma sublateritium FD-334 SS-4]|uniref:Uncharacterized protein n=1 Tax=Hypholoma sublateritium (strain FD-334 SS-4) TaxID=945553 RepID=A0A0D2L2K1_HYPSF|nr:hypothetical protein HYPSUDRAFT_763762 [Hypholoma sublateritium FD-334 SS-4]
MRRDAWYMLCGVSSPKFSSRAVRSIRAGTLITPVHQKPRRTARRGSSTTSARPCAAPHGALGARGPVVSGATRRRNGRAIPGIVLSCLASSHGSRPFCGPHCSAISNGDIVIRRALHGGGGTTLRGASCLGPCAPLPVGCFGIVRLAHLLRAHRTHDGMTRGKPICLCSYHEATL